MSLKTTPSRKVIKVVATVHVSYSQFNTKAKNVKAEKQIRRWIESTLKRETEYIPLYVEKDGSSYVEDNTERTKIKIK